MTVEEKRRYKVIEMGNKNNKSNKREKLGSRLGFIMLSAGCAIGCGNVWKFPWMCGKYGGGSFVLIYLICLLILGLPAMTMEFAIGRAAQRSPLYMFQELEKPGSRWGIMGVIAVIGNLALMAFYTVVAGWILNYFIHFLIGRYSSLTFKKMITDPVQNVAYLLIIVVVAFLVLSFQLQGGLERATKYMMLALLFLMLIIMVHCLTLPGAGQGIRFYLVPNLLVINGTVIVQAMNQAFFTLSVGMGAMAIFGSYINKDYSLLGEAGNVIALDTFVAILAGIIIFPACYSYNMEIDSGPSLLFNTMSGVFAHMAGGRWWGTLFFLFMVFAAMSTVMAVCENILAMSREMFGWSRKKGSLICGIVVFALGLTTALGYSVLHFQPFAKGTTWLDFWDFIVSNNILPLGCLAYSLFCCDDLGWGWDNFVKEANSGQGEKIKPWMKPLFRIVVPVSIMFIYVYGMVTFNWR